MEHVKGRISGNKKWTLLAGGAILADVVIAAVALEESKLHVTSPPLWTMNTRQTRLPEEGATT